MATYTAINASSIGDCRTYSDAGLLNEVENLTSKVANVGTGLYELTSALDYSLYSLGQLYYLKITYTPVGDTQRTQSFPFYVFPAGQPGGLATDTDTDAEGQHVQAPYLRLRVGCGAFRNADLTNRVAAARNRYEALFPLPAERRGKILHLIVYSIRAGEPWAANGWRLRIKRQGSMKVGQG